MVLAGTLSSLPNGIHRYQLGDWRGALDCLPLATHNDDELAQNAAYHMADCYLNMGDEPVPAGVQNSLHA